MRFAPARAAACGLATLLCLAPAALAEPAGTGLFAPVARQLHADLERLRSLPPGAVTPERIELLLATGQADAAARELGRLRGEPRAVCPARVEPGATTSYARVHRDRRGDPAHATGPS